MDVFNLFYQNESGWLNHSIQIFNSEGTALGFAFEKAIEEPYTQSVGMKELTFYHNSDDGTLSVSWIDRNAHYLLLGNITEEELQDILEGFKK